MDSLPQSGLEDVLMNYTHLQTHVEQQLCPFPVFRKCNVTVLLQIKVVMENLQNLKWVSSNSSVSSNNIWHTTFNYLTRVKNKGFKRKTGHSTQ